MGAKIPWGPKSHGGHGLSPVQNINYGHPSSSDILANQYTALNFDFTQVWNSQLLTLRFLFLVLLCLVRWRSVCRVCLLLCGCSRWFLCGTHEYHVRSSIWRCSCQPSSSPTRSPVPCMLVLKNKTTV